MKIKAGLYVYLITSKVALDPEKLRLLGQGKAHIHKEDPERGKKEVVNESR